VSYLDGRLRSALLADLVVEPAHRTLFPVLTLVRRAREIAAGSADYQYSFPNARALPVLQRVGYRVLGRMARRVAVLRAAPYVERRVPIPAVARISGAVLDAAVGAVRHRGRSRAAAGMRVELAQAPDDRIDSVYQEARSRYPLLAERTAAFLRWRFPGTCRPVDFAVATGRADGAPRAYAVITRAGSVAHLSDFLGAGDPDLEALLRLLAPVLRSRGFASASARFLGTGRVQRVLESCGFRRRDEDRAVVLDVSGCPAPLARVLLDAESHYLTDADEDA
jgi:hypothetical protein